jgi:DNA-binding CsgD family transcriptional regulator
VAAELPVLRPFMPADRIATALARLAPHVVATRAAADLVMRRIGAGSRDEVRLLATVHDLGKVVLAGASEDYLAAIADTTIPPEQALAEERRRLAIDHAAIGAIAVRRLGLPKSLAIAVERHHADEAKGAAAVVRLADMLAHAAQGHPVTPTALAAAAKPFRLEPGELQRIAYELTRSGGPTRGAVEPSPLTATQEKVLQALAARRTYKQIAAELSISESTVRSHLHNIYGRLDVADRAQAVLLAAERGWIG